jgi:hypothetical protein
VDRLQRKSRDPEVVTFDEVGRLLPDVTQRVLLIYDESVNRAGRQLGMVGKLERLMASSARLTAFAYFNSAPGQPNIVCIGNQAGAKRLSDLRRTLQRNGIPQERFLRETQ